MFDLWVQDVKTKECWRVDHDSSKAVYLDENNRTVFDLKDVAKYKFFPCCPKEAPTLEVNENYEQMDIYDFLNGEEF